MNEIKKELPEWYTELTAICLTDTVSLLTEIKIRTLIEQKLSEARIGEDKSSITAILQLPINSYTAKGAIQYLKNRIDEMIKEAKIEPNNLYYL